MGYEFKSHRRQFFLQLEIKSGDNILKTIIVYYTFEGNCAIIAKMLESSINAKTLRIKTLADKKRKKAGGFFWGMSQMFFNRKPSLVPYDFNVNDWDLIILGMPVWAGDPVPAMQSFLKNTKISGKKVALFCTHAGNTGSTMETLKALLAENTIVGEIDFKSPKKSAPDELQKSIDEWAKTFAK